ncbi:VirB3 family type IV secretion system protein [Acidithiobacillus ferridurans]|uniref:Uncharacterized protein n=1 Tax=Acidithiobacillus ferridurans TaxID=1232575 RepID=A0A8X8KB22_ACIFI|nr:VirB3 family type IV secretion system protein [Acidithiobacillus ferridurans]MBU2714941.1 hypothetical protein [Acidithiobacillus ferridurans]MBU2722798.1 hypothetical protein [Acidithiobacillus ferridurans]MBU2727815.1 hypothetical protein [Acidithiobacillus ferridurans]MCL5051807.1 VirB3 family type IV secretion system protein [Gammaproteobacteria bacterium]
MAQASERRRSSKVYRAMIGRRRIMGIPVGMFVMNMTTSLGLAWMTGQWAILAFAVGTFWVLRHIYKNDPSAVEVYFRNVRQGVFYEPWPHADTNGRDGRPNEFGKGQSWL